MGYVIAVDLGASNGRMMLASLKNGKLQLEELHRFGNEPFEKKGHLYWDSDHIFSEIIAGLQKYSYSFKEPIAGIGFDTWGVDFGVIDQEGSMIHPPYSYRDTHTQGVMDELHQKMDRQSLFERTGVEPAAINTIYQLFSILKENPTYLKEGQTILTMPSLLSYLFSGLKFNEFTHASTTQLLNPYKKDWDQTLMENVFDRRLPLADFNSTNTILGPIKKDIIEDLGVEPFPVITVPGHDTACALASIPKEKDSIFMSCGTWVLIGLEVSEPVVSEEVYQSGFTNEGTLNEQFRLQKNNMGLWLIQQCRKEWEEQGEVLSFEEQEKLMIEAAPLQSLVDPDDKRFFNPDSMVKAIQSFCKETGQPIPGTKGEITRCILESLALKYRWVITHLENVTGIKVPSINMAGGGIRNKWLCQFTANATMLNVKAGPIEASSIGNALSQFMALGDIETLEEARRISSTSFPTIEYYPQDSDVWNKAYKKFEMICLQEAI